MNFCLLKHKLAKIVFFLLLDGRYWHYKLCWPRLSTTPSKYHVLIQLHMLELNEGKDCQIVRCAGGVFQC